MARFSFYTTDGPDKGTTFHLEIGITLVGRRDTAASDDPAGSKRWILTDPAVSRTHARVEWDGESAPVLVHLSSTNATLLNGKIVTGLTLNEGARLSNGNVIRMGQTGFEVQEVAATSAQWCLVERSEDGTEHALEEHKTVELDGLAFEFNGSAVQVSLEKSDAEAYLLRRIDDQYWTTTLKESQPLVLKADDVVQTEKRKMVLVDL
jgi:FHA domain-containing protein